MKRPVRLQLRSVNLRMQGRRSLLAGLVVILAVVTILTVAGEKKHREPVFRTTLRDVIDAGSVPGWTTTHPLIASSPDLRQAVVDLLNFDEIANVVFMQNGTRVSVYAAYWKPGKMPHTVIARHTPIHCWTLSGWHCERQELLNALPIGAGRGCLPGTYCVFSHAGKVEHVVFWHIVDGRIVGQNPWYTYLGDMTRQLALPPRHEQFFLRVSSDKSLETIVNTPVFKAIFERFPFLARPSV